MVGAPHGVAKSPKANNRSNHGHETFSDRFEDDMVLFVDLMAFYVMEDVS